MRTLEAPTPGVRHKISKDARILLMQLPFWTPLIPPQGIARLKAYLKRFGYNNIITIDANMEIDFKNLYEKYFDTAKTYIPSEKQGNFYDNGHDLLKNHLMAKLNQTDRDTFDYIQLIKLFYLETYLCDLDEESIKNLDHIIDIFYEKFEKYLVDLLKKEQPSVLGLTVHSGNLPASMFAYRLAKKHNPGVLTVMGGSIFAADLGLNTPDFELFLKTTRPYLDRLIVGQGEQAFLKLLAGEIPSDQRVITVQEGDMLDISSFERPDLTDFDLKQYSCMASYCSSSCPNRCSFCNERAYFGDFQSRDPVQAVQEMIDINQQSGVNLFYMLDVIMNDVITDFTTGLKKHNLPIYFDCYLRVSESVCDPDNTISWRQGGCYRVRLGVESGSQRMLDLIGKEIKVEQTKAALASLARAGIKTTGYMVVGLPGETEEDLQQTLDFIEETKDYFYQVEPHLFRYFYTGQSHSDKWAQNRIPVYPLEARENLICQTWWVKGNPSRRTAVERLCTIVEHCKRLGITNPYTVYDKYKADLRWKKLHENAVPAAAQLNEPPQTLIAEKKAVKKRVFANLTIKEEGDFDI